MKSYFSWAQTGGGGDRGGWRMEGVVSWGVIWVSILGSEFGIVFQFI
ncbi:hypothetical protein [Pedobacter nutrimenti]|nr:hypothetical protein [Pedobacter nutrimenti]